MTQAPPTTTLRTRHSIQSLIDGLNNRDTSAKDALLADLKRGMEAAGFLDEFSIALDRDREKHLLSAILGFGSDLTYALTVEGNFYVLTFADWSLREAIVRLLTAEGIPSPEDFELPGPESRFTSDMQALGSGLCSFYGVDISL